MRLILVRHPRTLAAPGVCYGSSDIGVAPDELARVAAQLAASLPAGAPLFSSPLRRCAELAVRLGHAAPAFDARLAEMDFGAWELQPWDTIARAEIDAWAADPVAYRPGGGESVLQVARRVQAFCDDLRGQPFERAIVVCHAGTMRLISACGAGLPLAQTAQLAASTPNHIAYGALLHVDI
jgi:alpha-ribazole phosphatase